MVNPCPQRAVLPRADRRHHPQASHRDAAFEPPARRVCLSHAKLPLNRGCHMGVRHDSAHSRRPVFCSKQPRQFVLASAQSSPPRRRGHKRSPGQGCAVLASPHPDQGLIHRMIRAFGAHCQSGHMTRNHSVTSSARASSVGEYRCRAPLPSTWPWVSTRGQYPAGLGHTSTSLFHNGCGTSQHEDRRNVRYCVRFCCLSGPISWPSPVRGCRRGTSAVRACPRCGRALSPREEISPCLAKGSRAAQASYPARSSILPSLRPPQAQASPSSERLAAPMSPLFCSAGALRLRVVVPDSRDYSGPLRVRALHR